MHTIDLNCDMGEGIENDASIMPFISSANIACGFHAGDEKTIKRTIELCSKHNVAVGAHPSFYDKKNFGRTEQDLSANEIYDIIILQLRTINKIANEQGKKLSHIKPHGALYNLSAKDQEIAAAIARAVKDFDEELLLFGLSGSYSIMQAKAFGLKTAGEAFADRSYQEDGSLTPRSQSSALIEDVDKVIVQVLQMIKDKTVTTVTGKKIPILAETICIHGDGEHAVEFAKAIHQKLKQHKIEIKAL